eukprot:TRINITY_DN29075_c0_g2_i1.p1 TRINITY_DN29075_c0_g2~~TRINITY_DN29075_c0_g2_i1.p1  ORF type:complete len:1060 (-),score=278.85 TRINITY_DN29075_c0_g2_i1:127-3024(-)
MNPVLQSINAELIVGRWDSNSQRTVTRVVSMDSFFTGYRKIDLLPGEVIISVKIPLCKDNEYVFSFKQARRREDDIAIVSSCMRVRFADDSREEKTMIVKEACISLGGMAERTVIALDTSRYLIGRSWNHETLEEALRLLEKETYLPDQAVGGMPRYRQTLALSFFFKFFMNVGRALGFEDMSKAANDIHSFKRGVSSGSQTFAHPVKSAGSLHKPLKHSTAIEQVCGEAKYIDDIAPQFGELQAALVTTTRPHARIISIDWTEAEEFPGVEGVFHADHVPHNTIGEIVQDEPLFAKHLSQFFGQSIGIVVASSQEIANAAARLVKIEYEDLPSIMTIEEAIEARSFLSDEFKINDGDLEGGFADSDIVIQGQMKIGGQEHFYLEPNSSLVVPGEGREMKIFASTQNPRGTQEFVSHCLGIPANQIVCVVKRMGGGFGGKETRSINYSCAAAVAAFHTRRPVRIVLDRDVDMSISGHRHGFLGEYKVGVKRSGKIQSVSIKLFSNGGFSCDLSIPVIHRALFHVDNSYKFPNIDVRGRVCKTNQASHTAFRGFGGPQGMMVCEVMMEHVARELGLRPETVREMHLYKEGESTHYGQKLEQFYMDRMWADIKRSASFDDRLRQVNEFNAVHQYRKRGIALLPTKFGISFTATFLNQGAALVHCYTDGSVLVTHGGTEMGQGLHTKMRQVAAHELGISVDQVFTSETATDKIPNTSATAASQGSDINGMAVMLACRQIKEGLQPLMNKHPDKSFADICKMAWFERINLSAHAFFKVPDICWDAEKQEGKPFNYFTSGVACSEVEIDVLTGDFHIIRTDITMDLGASLNPSLDVGQIEGAFAQGLGWCTIEEIVWGDKDHQWVRPGTLQTRGPGAYKIPSFNDVPLDFRISLLPNAPNSRAVHSSRAVGEPPLFLASSVYFAIRDAVHSTRSDNGRSGFFALDSPATCERIRMACADRIAQRFYTDRD